MNTEKQPRVLVIDDEEDMREVLSRMIGALGCEVSCAASAEESAAAVREARGQIERAVAEYEAEIAQTPKAFKAAFNLGKLLMRARPEEARTRFRESVEWNPEFGTGYLYLAKSLLDTGELDEAEEAAQTGLAKNPESETAPLGHYILADIYNRRGRPEEAAREVAAARKLERGG